MIKLLKFDRTLKQFRQMLGGNPHLLWIKVTFINGNHKTNLGEKHMVKVNFHKKECEKSDVVLYLGITNPSSEYLESMLIFRISSFL